MNHGRCGIKHNSCLIPAACSTDYLGELLVITKQMVEAEHGSQSRFALLACQSDWHGSVLAQAVWPQSAVERADDVPPLPVRQKERLASVLAFDVT